MGEGGGGDQDKLGLQWNHPSPAGTGPGWAVPVSAAMRSVKPGPGKGAEPRCRSSSRFAIDCFTARSCVIPATSPKHVVATALPTGTAIFYFLPMPRM